jgi:HSP20 family protein
VTLARLDSDGGVISLPFKQEVLTMLVRWTPFNEMARLQQDLDSLFGGSTAAQPERVNGFTPAVDVVEDDQKFELYADLPGVSQADLDIQVEKDVLTIKGERKVGKKGERVSGAFSRAFSLPKHVDVEKIAASLKDGVLTLTLPKRPEAQPRQIKVAITSKE